MKKNAFLITAYKDKEQIEALITFLTRHFDCDVFVHLDKKCDINQLEIPESSSRIMVFKTFNVNWGSFNHLRAQLLLIEKACETNIYRYFHLITGQDFPLVNSDKQIEEFLDGSSYIHYGAFPNEGWTRGGMSRVDKYHFLNLFNLKEDWQLSMYDVSLRVQYALGIKNNRGYADWFYNSPYWSLHRREIKRILDVVKYEPNFLDRFKYCYIPEEIFYGTVLNRVGSLNYLKDDSKRFEDWDEDENPGSVPAVLGQRHLEKLLNNEGKCLFARKFDINNYESFAALCRLKKHLE